MRRLAGAAVLSMAGLMLSSLAGCSFTDGGNMLKDSNADAPQNTGFVVKTLTAADGHTRKYSVFVPYTYNNGKKWPVIMFLHGMGEGGSDGVKCLTVGLGPEIKNRASTFGFIAVFPQSGDGNWDENSSAADDAMAALHQVEKDYSCDTNCVALTGLSHGGYGTWAIGAKYVNEFTALMPMCSEPDYKDVPTLVRVPGILAYHFSGDPFVSCGHTTGMCDEINKAGGHARAEIIEAFGHACWHDAYGGEEMYQFVLSTRRPRVPTAKADDAVKANQPG